MTEGILIDKRFRDENLLKEQDQMSVEIIMGTLNDKN